MLTKDTTVVNSGYQTQLLIDYNVILLSSEWINVIMGQNNESSYRLYNQHLLLEFLLGVEMKLVGYKYEVCW